MLFGAFTETRRKSRIAKADESLQSSAIMLSDAALELMRDVFGSPDLLRGAHRIRKRVVAWGRNDTPKVLEHSAAVVSEQTLLEALTDGFAFDDDAVKGAAWTILAAALCRSAQSSIGSDRGVRAPSGWKSGDNFDFASCWIESLENGWLFLIPDSSESAWLLSVGQPPESLLDSSRMIAKEITGWRSQSSAFPSAPSIIAPLAGERADGGGWLACGTAAMGFDPICGDGTAHAIREAILAAAVVDAAEKSAAVGKKETTTGLLAHYSSLLIAGFDRHLRLCGNFYSSGYSGAWEVRAGLIKQGSRGAPARSSHRPNRTG